MEKKKHTLTRIFFLAITKWKSNRRWPDPMLHLMRKFMNSQNQSLISTRFTKIQLQAGRNQSYKKRYDNQELILVSCGFAPPPQVSFMHLSKGRVSVKVSLHNQHHSECYLFSRTGIWRFFLDFFFLKNQKHFTEISIPWLYSVNRALICNFWNTELPNLEGMARMEENQAKHAACRKSYFQLHKIILRSHISRLSTN